MPQEFIKVTHIDTTVSAINFSYLLKDNKTYFLNGAWGSGKTKFLENVEIHTKKKFITLDFWRVTDERSIISIAVSKLLPKTYWGLRIIMILSVVTSVLMTDVVNLGLSKFLITPLIAQIAGVTSLIVAVWSFFKIKSDSFYVQSLNKCSFKDKVLVIDDFDRINPLVQEQIYILFNVLEKNIPIIFVGDYSNLSKNNGKFLQKIISRKVELPFALQPQNIWSEYFNELENKLNFSIPEEFKKIVINEQRNLREREQFNDYVNNEFFVRKKLNYVQPIHQLLIIYVYLFYPDYYNTLLSDSQFAFADQFQNQEKQNLNYTNENSLPYLLYSMQRIETDGYPYPFAKNKQGYFLYEQPSNQTVQDLNESIEDNESLSNNLLSDMNSDFSTYIRTKYIDFENKRKNKIFVATLKLVREYKSSPLIRFIINEKNEQIMPREQFIENGIWGIPEERTNKNDKQIHKEIYNSWHIILNKYDFDFSQELYLLAKYSELNFKELGVLFPDIKISDENFKLVRRKDYLLITFLASKKMNSKMAEWPTYMWEAIEELSDDQFLAFWVSQGILVNKKFDDFDVIPDNKQYTLWKNKVNFEYPDKVIDNTFIIERIEHRINKLESKGYTFIKKHQK